MSVLRSRVLFLSGFTCLDLLAYCGRILAPLNELAIKFYCTSLIVIDISKNFMFLTSKDLPCCLILKITFFFSSSFFFFYHQTFFVSPIEKKNENIIQA